MGRPKKPTNAEVVMRLATVSTMIAAMAEAMPTVAKELRREAREELSDLIGQLR